MFHRNLFCRRCGAQRHRKKSGYKELLRSIKYLVLTLRSFEIQIADVQDIRFCVSSHPSQFCGCCKMTILFRMMPPKPLLDRLLENVESRFKLMNIQVN